MKKKFPGRVGLVGGVACLALLFAIPTAGQARKVISGKLSAPDYTVLALKANGKATSARAKPRKFRLKPPAKVTTLHLRKKGGTYGGPIVLATAKHGKRALVGVSAGAKLGVITIKGSNGYSKVKRKPPKRFIDPDRYARARHGVPIGARKFGRVRSKHTHGGVPGDLDLDGIPDALDIDDDGDLVLDNFDRHRSTAKRGAPATTTRMETTLASIAEQAFLTGTQLPVPLEDSANVNAGSTDEKIESALVNHGILGLGVLPGDSSELDCAARPNPSPPPDFIPALRYCSPGGTGKVFSYGTPPSSWPPFPDCCDPDEDGFGTLTGVAAPGTSVPFMLLAPGANSAEINTGDLLIQRVTTGGVESQFPANLQMVFATVPALVSYSDTASHSGTVSYPVSGGDPGTVGNGLPVKEGTGGDVEVTLTFWRPQRRPIPPETGDWIDVGGLTYEAFVQHVGALPGGAVGQRCPQSSYTTSDPDLGPPPPEVPDAGLTDSAKDGPLDPSNKLTYTLNLTDCLASFGVTWNDGDEVGIDFIARVSKPNVPDNALQNVAFTLQP